MPHHTIKVITFDLDDTLWSIEPVLERAEQRVYAWLARHTPKVCDHFSIDTLRTLRIDIARQRRELAHQISQLRKVSLQQAMVIAGYDATFANEQASLAFNEFIEARHEVALFDDALELLETLSRSYQLGALTNGNADVMRLPIGELFDFAFAAEQLNASKPAPDLFHAAMNISGASANQMVHIGDHIDHDIMGAIAAGCHSIWFNPEQQAWPYDQPAPLQAQRLTDIPALLNTLK